LAVSVLLFVSPTVVALALDPSRNLQQYNCQTWNRQNGLPANGINAIAQTNDGYLWLGTQSGLIRFDGVKFEQFNLPEGRHFRSEVVSSLASSRDGGLWFGITAGSFGFYNEQEGISAPKDATWADPAMNVISLREVSDGSLWLGTDKGVARYVKGNTSAMLFDPQLWGVGAIADGANGRVWLATVTQGLYYWEAGEIHVFPDESLKREPITCMVVDRQGQFWTGSSTGVRCYDSNLRPKELPPFGKDVKTLFVDRHGVVWIGTTDDGLACYKNGVFNFLRQSDGLAHNLVTSIFEDREGSLWVGTREGLSQLTDVKFPTYSSAEGLTPGSCHGVSASAKGGLWIATSRGVSYFDGKRAENYTTQEGLSNRYIKRAHEARNGDVYLINGKMGIDILSGGKIVATFPNDRWPTAMAEDDRGVIVSLAGSVFRIGRAGLAPYFQDGQAPSLTWIRNLISSRDGSLWIASVNGVLKVTEAGVQQQFTTATGLSDNDVYSLVEDSDGAIWAGLTTGIARIKNGEVRNITRRDGLLDDAIYAIVPDDRGQFWINSSRGIFRVGRQELNDFADGKTGRVESTTFNGINVVKTIDSAEVEYLGCKTLDGRIWFPSPLGAVAIDPARIPTNQTPPSVTIESVRANSENLPANGLQRVPPGPGELEFHFAALSFIAPQKVRFRYRLEGYDNDWVETENRRQAFYTNLKPGRYTFRVTAANADGIWNTTGDALEIELQPRFHQTTWFYLLCGGLAAGALAGLYLWRIRALERKERALQANRILLETEVRNRTADLQKENTERKLAEEGLREKTALLEAQVDASIDGILVVDTNGKKVFQNQRTIDLLKIPPEIAGEAEDKNQLQFVVERTRNPQLFLEKVQYLVSHPNERSRDEIEFKDGTVLDRYTAPVIGKDGKYYGRIWAFRDITERKQAEFEMDRIHRQLMETSRQAGMAEVATGVLHNVGNVLNSVNVSATLVADHMRHTKAGNVAKLAVLFDQNKADLAGFLTNDARGKTVPAYLGTLAEMLAAEQKTVIGELDHLRKNVEHIKDIVAMQQSYARTSGVIETISVPDMVEDAIRMNAGSLARHDVDTFRDYQARPVITTDKHKVMQILINLVRNAKYACDESGRTDKLITVRITADDDRVKIAVIDNGVGIPAGNLTRIFNHGFTTRKHGHGFGLHSGALAAKELGGSLDVHSDGPGHGAVFTLALPYRSDESRA
jgi:ligand-binding sensor domain-containing protein/signal transduction histidine kinase